MIYVSIHVHICIHVVLYACNMLVFIINDTHLSLPVVRTLSSCNGFPLCSHSILSIAEPVVEQLNIAVPPELTIWTCGNIWTDTYEFTNKRISIRCSPNWFDAWQTCKIKIRKFKQEIQITIYCIHVEICVSWKLYLSNWLIFTNLFYSYLRRGEDFIENMFLAMRREKFATENVLC